MSEASSSRSISGAARRPTLFERRAGGAGRHVSTVTTPSRTTPPTFPLIVCDEGYGKNDYIETAARLVVVTAPGPGSGKMATCLSASSTTSTSAASSAGYAKYRDLPDLESAAQASGESRLRGGDGRSGRRQHDRPVPSRGLRRHDRQLQPRRGGLSGRGRRCSAASTASALTRVRRIWESTWRAMPS